MFQQFSAQDGSQARRRMAVATASAVGIYVVIGLVLVEVLAMRTPPPVEKEVDVTFYKAPPVVAPQPPPPPPPPQQVKRPPSAAPPALKPMTLVAPKEVPKDEPKEADPSQEKGLPGGGGSGDGDPAALPGGGGPAVAAPVVAAPPPPPPVQAVVLPAGATPPENLTPDVKPEYPRAPKAAGVEGEVIVKVIVHTDGHVELVQFVKSDANFDEAVKAIIAKLRYKPAVYDGKPIAVFRILRYPFKLVVE